LHEPSAEKFKSDTGDSEARIDDRLGSRVEAAHHARRRTRSYGGRDPVRDPDACFNHERLGPVADWQSGLTLFVREKNNPLNIEVDVSARASVNAIINQETFRIDHQSRHLSIWINTFNFLST